MAPPARTGGKVTRDAGPVKGGTSEIAFVEVSPPTQAYPVTVRGVYLAGCPACSPALRPAVILRGLALSSRAAKAASHAEGCMQPQGAMSGRAPAGANNHPPALATHCARK